MKIEGKFDKILYVYEKRYLKWKGYFIKLLRGKIFKMEGKFDPIFRDKKHKKRIYKIFSEYGKNYWKLSGNFIQYCMNMRKYD